MTSRFGALTAAAFLGFIALLGIPQAARAVPALQLYIEGATYDSSSESWVLSGAGSFNLWVIGNVAARPIYDVKLAAAVATSETGSITLVPTTTGLITDPSTPIVPSGGALSADGAVPVLGSGGSLPTHGIYGPGTSFHEWYLGHLTLTDSPVGDFINSFPTSFPSTGQVNVYTVSVTGYSSVHFDLYNHFAADRHGRFKSKFAPFSHDAEVSPIPEPESYAMLLAGLVLLGFFARRRKEGSNGASSHR